MDTLLSFILATTIVSFMPGPSMALIMMHAVDRGFATSVQTSLGAVLADAILLVLALSGVGAILYSSALAFTALKWVGVVYLIWLGIAQLRSPVNTSADQPASKPGNAFLQGLGVTLFNPKIIGFLIMYFPQFLDAKRPALPQLLVLGPLFLLVVFVVFLICAMLAHAMRRLLLTERGRLWFRNTTGGALIGCGLLSMRL
ncbi:LysE family translocator [Leeia aquatica]|uniref:LysE family translocator n=1 Tax=Leeia aquatica TaxID=2725557 RepID=A0A847S3K8_9NEIS|nr:LysE family translocator [Leeia aquatica]NLR74344.1 LysE family translocator [Leeia aquatica]